MEKDPFKEYIRQSEPNMRDKVYVWHTLSLYDVMLQKANFSKKTLGHIQKLYEKFGNEKVFGRKEIIDELGITESPASELIRKMLEIKIIAPVQGKGKGKYVFSTH
ncbi:MAG: hypothetical protein HDP34_00060 [Clostridia bacterium]|nr:hypothetical protein [Clostridia bacterium]